MLVSWVEGRGFRLGGIVLGIFFLGFYCALGISGVLVV